MTLYTVCLIKISDISTIKRCYAFVSGVEDASDAKYSAERRFPGWVVAGVFSGAHDEMLGTYDENQEEFLGHCLAGSR